MATNSIRNFRSEHHRLRQGYEARPPYRTYLSVQYRTALSPSDLEKFEAIPVHAYNADGTFKPLPGYDDPTNP